MKAKAIIARITTKVKSILQERAEPREASLTVENAGIVVDGIQEAVFAGTAEGLKTWLEASETQENTIVHDGQKYQFHHHRHEGISKHFRKIHTRSPLVSKSKRREFHSA